MRRSKVFLAPRHSTKARSRNHERFTTNVISGNDGRSDQQLSETSREHAPAGNRRDQETSWEEILPETRRNARILGDSSRRGIQEAHGLSNPRRSVCVESPNDGLQTRKPGPTDRLPQRHGPVHASGISPPHRALRGRYGSRSRHVGRTLRNIQGTSHNTR